MKIRDLLTEVRNSVEYQKFLILFGSLNIRGGLVTQEEAKELVSITIEVQRKVYEACDAFARHALPHSMPKERSKEALAGVQKKADELDKVIRFTIGEVLPEFVPFLKQLEKKLAPKESKGIYA